MNMKHVHAVSKLLFLQFPPFFYVAHSKTTLCLFLAPSFCVQTPRRTKDTSVRCISPKDALFVMLLRAQFQHLKRAQKMSPAFQIFNFEENFTFYNLDQFSSKVPHHPPPLPDGPMVVHSAISNLDRPVFCKMELK